MTRAIRTKYRDTLEHSAPERLVCVIALATDSIIEQDRCRLVSTGVEILTSSMCIDGFGQLVKQRIGQQVN